MKSLVVYDSAYGNTAKIAGKIHDTLTQYGESAAKLVGEVSENDFHDVELLVIGSPTQGGRPTKPTQQFIDDLPNGVFEHSRFATFDTRFDVDKQKVNIRLLMKTIGYAASKMATQIEKRGGTVVSQPMGFIVTDMEGPLFEGELERAHHWADDLARQK